MLKLLISCWYDGVVVACRYMFVMGSDVVIVLLRRRTNTTSEPMVIIVNTLSKFLIMLPPKIRHISCEI